MTTNGLEESPSEATGVGGASQVPSRESSISLGREPGTDAPDMLSVMRSVAARRADHVAVEAPDATLTYAQLEQKSNQLAHALLARGVGRDVCVGVSFQRSAAELVALLAIAKAGGAYVVFDPSHPADRLRVILEDAAPLVMLMHSSSPLVEMIAGAQTALPSTHVIILDDLGAATEGHPTTPPEVSYQSDQLAYVLFTSGSTGRPKGVEIPRRAFANFLRSMTIEPGMSERDRLLAVSTTSFDIAGLDLFLPLYVGATVLIADRSTMLDPRRLRGRLENEGITVMQATPATWRLLLEADWHGRPDLRMFCGGEALSGALADRMLAGGGELWNMYGPTETTVYSSVQRIEPGYDLITIGHSVDRTQIYILDAELRLVPRGEVGEIYIGGLGLARGYRQRPDLTVERFVLNPHGPAGDRIYRTGDLGRMLNDGRIECLGRVDHQVKIRGFRIELGEIEAVLRQVPGVKEVLVDAAKSNGDPKLVAYWVGQAGRDALIEAARQKLPSYMVPVAHVHLDAFPLNTNGKIDRKSLPPPDSSAADTGEVKRPRNDAETMIAALWRDVLGHAHVGVDQDFFSLGGTSIHAIDLRARIEKQTGVELPLPAFFEAPTVEKLAAQLLGEGKSFAEDAPIIVELRHSDSGRAPLFCLLGVQLYQDLALNLQEDRPVIGIHLPFPYRPGVDPRPSVACMAAGYVDLIRQRQPHGPYHLAGLCFGGIVAYEAACQLEQQGEKVARVAVFDGTLPSAVHINQVRRVIGYVGAAITEPKRVPVFLREKMKRLKIRTNWVRALLPGSSAAKERPVDVAIDGDDTDIETQRFAETVSHLSAALLIVRATAEVQPIGVRLSPDLGWKGLADDLHVCAVTATHMDLLREPHVRAVADALTATLPKDEIEAQPRS